MEKFALLDFLKAFESLTGKGSATAEQPPQAAPPQSPQPTAPPSPPPAVSETNAMAKIIARHEEIANRIRNKK